MQIRPTAFTIGLIIYSFIALFFVYTEFGIDSMDAVIDITNAYLEKYIVYRHAAIANYYFNYKSIDCYEGQEV